MSKRTVFTTVTPLPSISRSFIVTTLHNHDVMIKLNPLVVEYHPTKPPSTATPEEFHCKWYSLTDKIAYLPFGLLSRNVTYNACFHDLPDGLQTHVYAPAGLTIKGKWMVGGSEHGESIKPRELGLDVPLQGLYLREDTDMKCNVLMGGMVKKNLKKSHARLVERIVEMAKEQGATTSPESKPPKSVDTPLHTPSKSFSHLIGSTSDNGSCSVFSPDDYQPSSVPTLSPVQKQTPLSTTVLTVDDTLSPEDTDYETARFESSLRPAPLLIKNRSPSSNDSSSLQPSPEPNTKSSMGGASHNRSSSGGNPRERRNDATTPPLGNRASSHSPSHSKTQSYQCENELFLPVSDRSTISPAKRSPNAKDQVCFATLSNKDRNYSSEWGHMAHNVHAHGENELMGIDDAFSKASSHRNSEIHPSLRPENGTGKSRNMKDPSTRHGRNSIAQETLVDREGIELWLGRDMGRNVMGYEEMKEGDPLVRLSWHKGSAIIPA